MLQLKQINNFKEQIKYLVPIIDIFIKNNKQLVISKPYENIIIIIYNYICPLNLFIITFSRVIYSDNAYKFIFLPFSGH